MGRIIAIGGGFPGEDNYMLANHIIGLSGKKNPNFLQIPTTSFDNRDAGTMSCFFNNGCNVDLLQLTGTDVSEEKIAEKIRRADIIHVPGGNLRYVMTVWEKTRTDVYLKEAFNDGKILFGTSSGAMCWFEEGYDDCGTDGEMMFVKCLGLHPYCCAPHFDSDFWHSFTDAIRTRDVSGLALENDAAICFIDDKRYVLTSKKRTDARCFLFDREKNFERIDLTADMQVLNRL